MPEENKPEDQTKDPTTTDGKGGEGKGKELSITATVDPTQMEEIIGRLKEAETKRDELAEKLKTETGNKDKLQEEYDTLKDEADDYKNKLTIIGKKKLEAKKAAIMDEAKKLIKDPERLKIIEDGIKGPEDVKGTEFLIETLKTTLAEGKKQHEELEAFEAKKKKLGAPDTVKSMEELQEWVKTKETSEGADPTSKPSSGTLTLEGQSAGGEEGYDSEAAMIYDLRKRSHNKDPEVAAEAKAILREMFRKWTVAVKKEYDNKMLGGVKIEKGKEQASIRAITLSGGAAREDEPKTEGA